MPTPPATVRVALLAAVLALVTTSPVAAVEAQGIRMDPTEPSVLGTGSVLRPAVPPGGAATYDLVLHNQHATAVEVLVYGADVTAAGEVASGTDNRGVGAWIQAAQPRVALGPGATTVAAVTVTRPAGDTGGGTGAIVAQLSEQSRQTLGLEVIRRAALRIEVAADGSGDGVHVEVAGTDRRGGLLPGTLVVDVRFTDGEPLDPAAGSAPGPDTPPAVDIDGAVVLSRPFTGDPTYDAGPAQVPAGGEATATVEVELPWYGTVGHLRAEAATPGLTTTSAPVRVVVVPPWLGLLLLALVVAVAIAALRARRDGTPFRLGRVPAPDGADDPMEGDDPTEPDGATAEPATAEPDGDA